MSMRPLLAACLAACLAAALAMLLAGCSAPSLPFARLAGLVTNRQISEISGLAASRAHADVLWAHNDSGNPARLYAISRRGRLLARFDVEGAKNVDWEDISSFDLQGRHYLLLADTGDNGGRRRDFVLYVFEEPATLENGQLRPVWSIHARWPDGGARDCEAVAVDAAHGQILLISKKRVPPELFTLPLADPHGATLEARRVGRLVGIPQASAEMRNKDPELAALFSQVTAADISPDRSTLAVLTYGSVLFYRRADGEDWADAVSHPPEAHDVPPIPQAEALTWSAGGAGLYATGEFSPAPIFYLVPQQ
ncbi:hypothetical protein [Thermomonas sp.]|uniref:hypothetical protein n=1 Tax=Thermomonas sp. TaxID=1971895 RepID=UPI00263818F7|nr:hypothetical protein [Thermomonas sp.]MCO5054933.1 hypothetical protein [Thermomonas sp.]